jgi:ubiquinone/menaquinone biosynthesis C-methylase UbiE
MISFKPEIIENAQKHLKGNDADFFGRVWGQDLMKYESRLKAIDFQNIDSVLDAGFGMGQWLVCLSKLNKQVAGIEYSQARVDAVNSILLEMNIANVKAEQGSVEALQYDDNSFDAVFCYGVIFLTDYRKALQEFSRVLKPGGKLYFTFNGLGWYLFCIQEEHNKTATYNPRQMAIQTINNSLNYFSGLPKHPEQQLIIPVDILKNDLARYQFTDPVIDSEGAINITSQADSQSFYSRKTYFDEPFIYEVLVKKSGKE